MSHLFTLQLVDFSTNSFLWFDVCDMARKPFDKYHSMTCHVKLRDRNIPKALLFYMCDMHTSKEYPCFTPQVPPFRHRRVMLWFLNDLHISHLSDHLTIKWTPFCLTNSTKNSSATKFYRTWHDILQVLPMWHMSNCVVYVKSKSTFETLPVD